MRRQWCSLLVAMVAVSTVLAGCSGGDTRASPKAGKQVVVARFSPEFKPRGVAVDGKGTVYTSGWDGKRFVMAAFPKKGKPTRRPIPCAKSEGFDDALYGSVVATQEGTLFWAMDDQNRVVRINPDGSGDCYAGTGEPGFSGDGGPAVSAQLDSVDSMAYDPVSKALYMADSDNLRVRRIDAAGTITTLVEPAGMSGGESINPMMIAFDARRGRLYVKERPGIVYRTRDGNVNLIPRSDAPGFASEGLAADPTGGDLVTTRIVPLSDVVRISDDGTVRPIPGGQLSSTPGGHLIPKDRLPKTDRFARQAALDDQGNIWIVTDEELIVIRPTP